MKANQMSKPHIFIGKGRTFRFYLPVILHNKLKEEATNKGIAVSKLLRNKLELLDQISFLMLKNNILT